MEKVVRLSISDEFGPDELYFVRIDIDHDKLQKRIKVIRKYRKRSRANIMKT